MDTPSGRPSRSWIALLLAAGLQALILYLFFAHIAFRPLDSYDGPWHLTCGRIIAETVAVPRADPICFTSEGLDWVNLNWLAQFVGYQSFRAFGFAGPITIAAACYALTLVFLLLILRRAEAPAPIALLIFALAAFLLRFVFDSRPRCYTFVLMTASAWILDAPDPERRFSYARAGVLLALMALWNQLHGGFVYGYALLGIDALGASIDAWREQRRLITRRALLLGGVIVLGLSSFALHPHGFAAPTHAALYASRLGATMQTIVELRPLDFTTPYGMAVEAYLVLMFVALLRSGRKASARDWILLAFFTHMTLAISRSMIPLLLFTAGLAGRQWRGVFDSAPRMAGADRALSPAMRAAPWTLGAAALIAFALAPALNKPGRPGELGSRARHRGGALPAIRFIKERGLQGRIFNDYVVGGWLGWVLYPQRRVAIDGRGDLHARGSTYLDYLRIVRMKEGWRQLLDEHQVELAILTSAEPLGTSLERQHGWRRLFDDGRFAVLARPDPQRPKDR